MMALNKHSLSLYVDRLSKQWVVRDPEGNFWTVPAVENGWEQRQPFHLTQDAELDVIPKHYIHLLDLPFLRTER